MNDDIEVLDLDDDIVEPVEKTQTVDPYASFIKEANISVPNNNSVNNNIPDEKPVVPEIVTTNEKKNEVNLESTVDPYASYVSKSNAEAPINNTIDNRILDDTQVISQPKEELVSDETFLKPLEPKEFKINEQPVNQVLNDSVKEEQVYEDNNKGVTFIVVLFILLFAFVIALPYIVRLIEK